VDRNRVKRRLREIGRRRVLPALEAAGVRTDVLLRARRSAYEVDYARLEREVMEAVEELCSRES
jgi:ribonuclease P protein component